jgi:hypothetical protein
LNSQLVQVIPTDITLIVAAVMIFGGALEVADVDIP